MKNFLLVPFLVILLLLPIFATDASATSYTITRLTNNTFNDHDIDINDMGHLVWIGRSTPTEHNIFHYNNVTIIQITDGTAITYMKPHISNDMPMSIVFYSSENKSYFSDGVTFTPINPATTGNRKTSQPYINDNGWQIWREWKQNLNSWHIKYYNPIDLKSYSVPDTEMGMNNYDPHSNNIITANDTAEIAWTMGEDVNAEIYYWDGVSASSIRITTNTYEDSEPCINDSGLIVWQGNVSGAIWEIFTYDTNTSTTTQITNNSGLSQMPMINNSGLIVYSRTSPDAIDLYDYNTSTTITGILYDSMPDINDSGQVVARLGVVVDSTSEIRVYNGNSEETITSDTVADTNPIISNNGRIAWLKDDGTGFYEVYIADPDIVITTFTLPDATVSSTYSQTPTTLGTSTPPFTWSISAGSLPNGLAVASTTGEMLGIPTIPGLYDFTLRVDEDSSSAFDTIDLSIYANPFTTVDTASLPNADSNFSYSQTLSASGGFTPYTWSIIAGALPVGLSLNASTGEISGIPIVIETANFTVQADDSNTPTPSLGTKALSITINSTTLVLNTVSLNDGVEGATYTQTATATGGVGTYSWSITAGLLPAGLSLNSSTGVISGTPTANGTSNFDITVTDSDSPTNSDVQSLSIIVQPSLTITTASLLDGVNGTVYSQTVSATGGAGTYSWSITAGLLPAGLTLNSSSGVISGTPTVSGTSNFDITVTDGYSPTNSDVQSLSIIVQPALTITTASLPDGVNGTVYSQALAATGGITSYTWSVSSGALPAGLTLNSSSGVISGTPTVNGTSNFDITVTDSYSPTNSDVQSLSITVQPPLSLTTASLPNGVNGTVYSQALSATGGITSYTWSVSSGALPAGLTLNSSSGVISGTPTANGTSNFDITVTDSYLPAGNTDVQSLSITLQPPLTITTASLPGGVNGTVYNQTVFATGGIGSYTWSVSAGTIPAGLTLNSSSGVISGTPTVSGTSNFDITITDSYSPTNSDVQSLSITVQPPINITTASLPDGVNGTVYSQTLAVAGGIGSYTWSVSAGTLPAGLTLNSSSGVISGTPTVNGTSNFDITITDSYSPTNSDVQSLSITVQPPVSLTTASLPNGVNGTVYSQALSATGGITSYTWSVSAGALPAGLTLNSSSGVISGTPTANGTSNFDITVTDSYLPAGNTDVQSLSITLQPSLTITTASLPGGVNGTVYSQTVFATGGIGSYTWSVSTGTIPAGLTLNSSSGVISGTPTANGTSNFDITVTDSYSPTNSDVQSLSIIVQPPINITTASLPAGVNGIVYSQTLAASGGITPYTWSVSAGTLPTGLTLNSSSGVISGTPTVNETSNFDITVTDSYSPTNSDVQSLSITVQPLLSLTTASLPNGVNGTVYSQALSATGGITSYTWSVSSGALPAGLTLNSSTGIISGTPTANGTSNFDITVTDSYLPTGNTDVQSLSITVQPPLNITTASLPDGVNGTVYNQTVSATGGIGSYTWSVSAGTIPAGLTLNSSTGIISGTPTANGTSNFDITVTDSYSPTNSDVQSLSITVQPPLTITTASLPDGVNGTVYNQTVLVTGGIGSYTWSVSAGTIPAGLTLNSSTGVISGTPTANGTSNFDITVTDSYLPTGNTNVQSLSITVQPLLNITTALLPDVVIGHAYNETLSATGGITSYTWSVSTGTLPAGLTLNSSSGVISGTPTANGTSNFDITVTDSYLPAGNTDVQSLSITVQPPLTITTASLPGGVNGTVYNQTVLVTGGIGSYTWSVSAGTIPAGLTLNSSSGVISGTPTVSGTSNFDITVIDTDSPTNSDVQSLSITVQPPLTITTASLPDGVNGTVYSQTLAASGGIGSYTWSVSTGTIPAGLTLNSSSGVISGTPTVSGTSNFDITITDSYSPTNSDVQSLSITVQPLLSLTTASLPDSVNGTVYSQTLAASGGIGSYTWSVSAGTIPAGLTLNSSSGVISGTPTVSGTSNFDITVTDSYSPTNSDMQSLSITVQPLLSLTTASLPNGVNGTVYSQALAATGGITSYTWSVSSGALPAGLTLNSSSGVISGTPTVSGTSNFDITVTDSYLPAGNTDVQSLSITLQPPLTITTASLPDGVNGTVYSQTLAASGGIGSYTWSVSAGTLPAGLTLNSSTGIISGTPTANGTSNFDITITDSYSPTNSDVQSLSITVQPPINITTASLPDGVNGTVYSQTLAASGGIGSYTWNVSAGTIPAGLTLNSSSGVISGTPTANGTSNFDITVTDSYLPTGNANVQSLSITVQPQLNITTASLPDVVIGHAYNETLSATGGITSYTWSVSSGALPAGLTLNSSNGVISGTPTANGTSNFDITVTDSYLPAGNTDVQSLSITVQPPLTITTASLLDGVNGTVYNQTVSATGGITPYSWSVSSGALPAGLTLNSSSGVISGTPTANGTSNFDITVIDTDSPTDSDVQSLSIIVQPPLTITTASLPDGVNGTVYNQTVLVTGGIGFYTWSVSAGTIPAGLTLNSSSGVISGTPTANGTSNFDITITDSYSPTNSDVQSLSITVQPPIDITTASLPDGVNGTVYSQTLAASGGIGSYTWNVSAGTIPAGLTLNSSSGVISGTPTVSGTSNFDITVTDSYSPTNSDVQSLSITVQPPVSLTTASLPNGVNGTVYSQALAATGGITSYTWSVSVGTLPAGLTLNSSSGVISGTPTVSGTSNFDITVTDSYLPAGNTDVQSLSITLQPPLTITTASLPGGVNDTVYNQTVFATGGIGSYTWSVSTGTIPAGLTLNSSSGVISGTPTVSGTSNFDITITDSYSPTNSDVQSLSITVQPPIDITTASLPDGVNGTVYSQTLAVAGGIGSYTWSVSAGTLPAGLTLNSSSGVISGTPTVNGTSNFDITVTDSYSPTNSDVQSLSITVRPSFNITTSSLPDVVIGHAYNETLSATVAITPYTWSVSSGALPAGLTLNSSNGVISGTPTANGTSNFDITVTDSYLPTGNTDVQSLSITVQPPLTITTASLPGGVNGTVYSQTLFATGGITPYTWSVSSGALPAGLTLNSSSGVISGTPTANGTSNFDITVIDSDSPTNSDVQSLSITVQPPLTITTASLPGGVNGTVYSQTLFATGGITPYTWSVSAGTLSSGLFLNSSTGVISGTPTVNETSNFDITVTDSDSPTNSDVQSLSITVQPPLTITTASLPGGVNGTVYNQTVSATGGITPYTWSVFAGTLPAGLTLNSSNGVISGTPTANGTSNFDITVTDSYLPTGNTDVQSLSIIVQPTLTITTASLPGGVNGTVYSQTLFATGGITPYTWSVSAGTIPAGLTLNSSSGVISGTPTVNGTSNFDITVTDGYSPTNSDVQSLSITVQQPLTITTASLPDGVNGTVYSQTLAASGAITPYTWSVSAGTLPAGLTLNSSTGVISGTTTANGTSNFDITVTDSYLPAGNTDVQSLSITVQPPLTITTASLPDGVNGTVYSQTLAATGAITPYSWSVSSGALPAGLTLNSSTGVISGTTTANGTSNFDITVTDSYLPTGNTDVQSLSIIVQPPLTITTASLPTGTASISYSETVSATGGIGSYSWSVSAGSLPTGLTLNSSTGVISGTPITMGTFNFDIRIEDSFPPTPNSDTKSFSVEIFVTPLIIGTSSLEDATMGETSYSETLSATGGITPYSWSVSAGTLPAGLTLISSTGVITGTPTFAGTSNFDITVSDSDSPTANTATQSLAILVKSLLEINTLSLPIGVINVGYTQSLSGTGGITPYAWSISVGSLPTGLTLNSSTGVISGIPTATGTSNFDITLTDSNIPVPVSIAQSLSITVQPSLTLTTSSLPNGVNGTTYSQILGATGGITPYAWSVSAGSLPVGLSLNSSTGVISGTPAANGTSNFNITVSDSYSPANTSVQVLSITVQPVLTITTSLLPDVVIGHGYNQTLNYTGGITPYSWSVSAGTLPAGLTLNTSTGVISGTPTATGTNNFDITVTDGYLPTGNTYVQALSITVQPELAITTSSLPDGVDGTAYSQTLAATGGITPYSWSVSTGTLPAGLTLNSSTGIISGAPTVNGTSNFNITVSDSDSPTTNDIQSLSITIQPTLILETSSLPDVVIGSAYNETVSVTGGITPYSWSVSTGTLPAGLTLNSSTGVLSGTPTATGTSNFNITVSDSYSPTNTSVQVLSITVQPLLTIITASLPDGVNGIVYNQTVSATGAIPPYTWSVSAGTLPAGLTLNSSTGVISGTPTASGTNNFDVSITDSDAPANSDVQSFSITVQNALELITSSLPGGVNGTAYTQTLTATGGITSYSWSLSTGTLPTGLTLNSSTGVISGTPTTSGTNNFDITVSDSYLPSANTSVQSLSITIQSALVINTSSLQDGMLNADYNETLTTTGGITPNSWSLSTGTLPTGLTLNSSTGVISGTPTSTGTSNFDITISDSYLPIANNYVQSLSITIQPELAINTSSLSDGINGAAYNQTLSATGGVGTSTWSVSTGTLPAGLTLNSSTGVISGTPTSTGANNFDITINDSYSPTPNSVTRSLSINMVPALTITTSSLNTGVLNLPYSETLSASGGIGSYTWSVSTGSLPAGLTLNSSTGEISGTPSVVAMNNFDITVTDSYTPTPTSNTNSFSLNIVLGLAISTPSLPDGVDAVGYSQTLSVLGGLSPYTWSVSTGSLPAGLTLNSSTGEISGTPTTTGTSNFDITVNDSFLPTANTDTKSFSINVQPVLTLTTSSLPDGVSDSSYSQTLAATGGIVSYTWSISTGSLPAGLSLDSATGIISGIPAFTGTSNFDMTVSDNYSPANSSVQSLSITVQSALTILTSSLPDVVIGHVYSQTLAATGGILTYSWSVTAGSLPAGLLLNSSTGEISGTPSVTGTSNFNITVSDSYSPANTSVQVIFITVQPTLDITTLSLTDGVNGNNYNQTLSAIGGLVPYTWNLSAGSLPPGLSLDNATGVISGIPTTSGTSNFDITATDIDSPANSAVQSLSITIQAVLVITTPSLPDGATGSVYSQTLAATGGITPYSWSVSSGSLPDGLVINSSTGEISGTPTTDGINNFDITVTDSYSPAINTVQSLSITVQPALSITTSSLPDGVNGTAYTQTLAATGGITPYSWSITAGSLPAGLTLNSATGVISGTPTVNGTDNFDVTASDSYLPANNTVQSLSITVQSVISITTSFLFDGVNGTAYTQTLAATGGITPYSWSITAGSLPAGLTLNSATGVISGTPTVNGTGNFDVTASDSYWPTPNTFTQSLSITVQPTLEVTTSSLSDGVNGTAYNQTVLATGGIVPYSFALSSGSLPIGLTLNSSTGIISGTPASTGTSNFNITLSDSYAPSSNTVTRSLSIIVRPTLTISTTSLSDGEMGTVYSQAVSVVGGLVPYNWSLSSGSLPIGLSFNSSTGIISGTPVIYGSNTFDITVTDSYSPAANATVKSLTIEVFPAPLIISTTSLPDAVIGTVFSQTISATGGVVPFGWSITVGSLPAGMSLNSSTGEITGTPTTTGTSNFDITITDNYLPVSTVVTQSLSITVQPVLVLTTASLPDGVNGTAYNQTLAFTGGITSHSWSITAGSLPAGLTLNATTGVISGTPKVSGLSNFDVTVSDSYLPTSNTDTKSLSINIVPALTINNSSVQDGVINLAYTDTVSITGGIASYTWSISSGNLPVGLSLNSSTGEISGTPTATGTSNFDITVIDAYLPVSNSFTRSFSITVGLPLVITTSSLPDGVDGSFYSQAISTSGGSGLYNWSLSAGSSLPPGFFLNGMTGIITGTATATGTSNLEVIVTDSYSPTPNSISQSLSITVQPALTILTSSLSDAVNGSAYTTTLTASGGSGSHNWSVSSGSLPPGLSLNGVTGIISGIATTTGISNFDVSVTDSYSPTPNSSSQSLSITVNAVLGIITSSLPGSEVGTAYTYTLEAIGGLEPYTWSIATGNLPTGLSLNSTTGEISGTPIITETVNFDIMVTDSYTPTQHNDTQSLSISTSFFNNPPTLSSSSESDYISDKYVYPESSSVDTSYTYKVVYFDLEGDISSSGGNLDVKLYIQNQEQPIYMVPDTSIPEGNTLRDGVYSNGEQFVYTTGMSFFSLGRSAFHITASDGDKSVRVPNTGELYDPYYFNTEIGNNVPVVLSQGSLTYDYIHTNGVTTFTPINVELNNLKVVPNTSYDITTTSLHTGIITVCISYDPADFLNVNPEELDLFHYSNGNWDVITTLKDIDNNIFCGKTSSLSPFVIGSKIAPTMVTLVSFYPTQENGKIILNWDSGVELSNEGYNILRSDSPNGPFVKINSTLISATATAFSGAHYAYSDNNLKNGTRYYYRLQDVDSDGKKTTYGMISAIPGNPSSLKEVKNSNQNLESDNLEESKPGSSSSTSYYSYAFNNINTKGMVNSNIIKTGILNKEGFLNHISGRLLHNNNGTTLIWEIDKAYYDFYISRSETGNDDGFYLINEIPINTTFDSSSETIISVFKYEDTDIQPGKQYHYMIEFNDDNGITRKYHINSPKLK